MFGIVICLAVLGDVSDTTVEVAENATKIEARDAARRYRIHVYNSLREQRTTYDERFETAQQVLELAERLPEHSRWQQQIVSWYADATLAVTDGDSTPAIPQIPESDFEPIVRRRSSNLTTPTATTPRRTRPSTRPTATVPRSTQPTQQGSLLKTIGGLFAPSVTNADESSVTPDFQADTAPPAVQAEIEAPELPQE